FVYATSWMGCAVDQDSAAPLPSHAEEDRGQCIGGPAFDPAGAKNVGNGEGKQFIGGQCLSAKDCASGCCALPCGICSGPGAQFQAGKQGCGFESKGGAPAQQTPPATQPPAQTGGKAQCTADGAPGP